MNKNDLIGAVADKTTVQKSEVEKIIDATLDIIGVNDALYQLS